MKSCTGFIGLIALVYFLLGLGTPAFSEGLELVELLVKNLGITTQQAEGGAGSIFNAAKQDMGVEDFKKVTTAMPEVEPLMAAAPKIEKSSGTLGGISSMLSEDTGSLGKMADLYDSFSQLGLSKDMVGEFIPLISDYAKSKGGETVSNLLKTALQ
ncbi:MAG: DUF2780 domain-containing protein [Deltaproteobacteria bacterium]|nr:DUF2780 domain-containing protein [Deltaproteobacteria bacterium]MBW1718146.1 DUF2780 domain-containing protein [Deltaproteobacteria bacterium]MBW1938212.1 DUF2780 domain-containing protein [Deltaproteobacteria bacterium]MBW1964001.1 DUF2780 domain-containing protein [Deltaproteobacteria bacterium]MBW2080352.1 DUF2780 domain-containing protein [Deltaproteobacteria bacterium]